MNIVCLDMEGVLTPEIWIEFADKTGIAGLRLTTRDEPDYDKLMKYRINLLKENGLSLADIQNVISEMEPLEGAGEFLDRLRDKYQVIILSDTFEEFARPLIKKLGNPTIFCNSLVTNCGIITDYHMRIPNSKHGTVLALKSIGFDVVSAGDSHNDLAMIRESKAGFLFRSTDAIIGSNPDLEHFTEYSDLADAIDRVFK